MDFGWTIGGVEADGLLTGTSPTWRWGESVTLEFRFRPPGVESRHSELLDYVRAASLASWTVYDTRGRPRYEERVPSVAAVSSLVVALEPGSDVIGVGGVWALITGGSDESRPVTGTRRVSLEVVPLAERSAYADRQSVADALGSGGGGTSGGGGSTDGLNPVPATETRTNDAGTTDTLSSPWVVQGTAEVQGTVEVQDN